MQKKGFIWYIKKFFYWLFIGILLFILSYSALNLYSIYSKKEVSHKAKKTLESKVIDKEDKYLEPDWEALKKINPDIIGWIYIPDTNINYPVVQKKGNNSYYLNVNAMLGYDEMGAIFLDAFTDPEFKAQNSIIYGHSVIGGGMFTDIKKFGLADFFKNHPYYYLLTPEKNYKCNIYTFAKTNSDSIYYLPNPSNAELKSMESKATYSRTLEELNWDGFDSETIHGNNMITLSTCDLNYGLDSDRRLILNGFLEEYEGKIKINE